ncbi:hypothetical protein [Pedobacter nutrimenti]|uniref:hypothetical protein n=1 Tax=Pedobacter nutrimenti TaxID=1241337 RepID=UPI002930E404|nr:hypothetical protein [Pedobacter nutrimenti]
MSLSKYIKILFILAGILLSVKPIIGFSISDHIRAADENGIFLMQKLFNKRKQEYAEEMCTEATDAVFRLPDLPEYLFTTIWSLLSFLFPLKGLAESGTTQRAIRHLMSSLLPNREVYISYRKLII